MHGRQRKEYEHFDLCRNKYALKDSDMEFDSISELLEYYQSHRISRTLGNIGIPVIRDGHGKTTMRSRANTICTEQPSYQGSVTSRDAKLRLQRGSSYPVGNSDPNNESAFQMLEKGNDNISLFYKISHALDVNTDLTHIIGSSPDEVKNESAAKSNRLANVIVRRNDLPYYSRAVCCPCYLGGTSTAELCLIIMIQEIM
jgi:hypothetical protein